MGRICENRGDHLARFAARPPGMAHVSPAHTGGYKQVDHAPGSEEGAPVPKRGSPTEEHRFQRRLFVALLSLAGLIAYCDRVNISVAIIDMARDHNWSMNEKGQVGNRPPRVPVASSHPHALPLARAQVLGSFFYGYLLSQIPGALLASR